MSLTGGVSTSKPVMKFPRSEVENKVIGKESFNVVVDVRIIVSIKTYKIQRTDKIVCQ